MNNITVIIPTHSNYIGVVDNFLQLLQKNWNDCPYKIIVSVTGDNKSAKDVKTIHNGKNASLIDCITNASNKHLSNGYICILGDMFINKKIDTTKIKNIIDNLLESNIDYCALSPVGNYKKEKKFNAELRYINNLDRYSHNFSAFFASKKYIDKELKKHKTDLDYEKSYLFQKDNFYYEKHLIVRKNYFNFLPGITKGKWDRINYRKLKKDNPEVLFDNRPIQSKKDSVICHVREKTVSHIPSFIRTPLKNTTEKVFKINFGVKG